VNPRLQIRPNPLGYGDLIFTVAATFKSRLAQSRHGGIAATVLFKML
jgi:hypothetical protein